MFHPLREQARGWWRIVPAFVWYISETRLTSAVPTSEPFTFPARWLINGRQWRRGYCLTAHKSFIAVIYVFTEEPLSGDLLFRRVLFFFCLRCRDEMFLLSRAFTFLLSNQILCFLKGLGNFQLLAKDRGPHGSLKIKLLFLFCFFNKSDHLGQSGQRKCILLLYILYIICVWICGICDILSPTINDRQTSSSSVKLRISLHLWQSNRSFHWTSLCRRLAKTLYSGFLPEPWCFFIEPLRSSSATTSTTGGRVQHRVDRPRPTSLTWTEKKCGIFNIWLRKTQDAGLCFFSKGLLSRASVHDLLTCMNPSASRRVGEGALFRALLFIVHHCFYYLFILAASFYAAVKHPTGHFKCCTSDGLAAEGRIGFLASPLPLFFFISRHLLPLY